MKDFRPPSPTQFDNCFQELLIRTFDSSCMEKSFHFLVKKSKQNQATTYFHFLVFDERSNKITSFEHTRLVSTFAIQCGKCHPNVSSQEVLLQVDTYLALYRRNFFHKSTRTYNFTRLNVGKLYRPRIRRKLTVFLSISRNIKSRIANNYDKLQLSFRSHEKRNLSRTKCVIKQRISSLFLSSPDTLSRSMNPSC